ncbi:LysR family transcriptional regulator [Marinobacter sp. F3R08]|uniref:LysR family transcriptional regulator n=1 Tax=Marinobacter sp. F3R08 TaxID=2841559 RepID=UPI001C09B4BF|nr:LysR family transcriptional regulator [Marinobacter sp. F3R08]MBU2955946.1 LysR family transcriptional regulator [Marinobacter sp. F3R08]
MKNQELNLLHVFSTIMTEGSITRAADRLGMTQPAVSNVVSRMRTSWKDPIFVKRGRQVEPTSYAQSLWDQIRNPLHELSNAVNSTRFSPGESRRTFRVAVTDLMLEMIWQPLVCELQHSAPGIDLHAVPFSPATAANQLRDASVDFVIGFFEQHDHSLRSHWLFDTGYVLAMRSGHALSGQEVDLDSFLDAQHLLATMSGEAHGVVDDTLQSRGLERRVAVTVNHFSAVPNLLRKSDLIATIPEVITGDCEFCSGLSINDLPIDVEPTSLYLAWHTRHDRDPGIIWIRNLMERVAKECWTKAMAARGRDCGSFSVNEAGLHDRPII